MNEKQIKIKVPSAGTLNISVKSHFVPAKPDPKPQPDIEVQQCAKMFGRKDKNGLIFLANMKHMGMIIFGSGNLEFVDTVRGIDPKITIPGNDPGTWFAMGFETPFCPTIEEVRFDHPDYLVKPDFKIYMRGDYYPLDMRKQAVSDYLIERVQRGLTEYPNLDRLHFDIVTGDMRHYMSPVLDNHQCDLMQLGLDAHLKRLSAELPIPISFNNCHISREAAQQRVSDLSNLTSVEKQWIIPEYKWLNEQQLLDYLETAQDHLKVGLDYILAVRTAIPTGEKGGSPMHRVNIQRDARIAGFLSLLIAQPDGGRALISQDIQARFPAAEETNKAIFALNQEISGIGQPVGEMEEGPGGFFRRYTGGTVLVKHTETPYKCWLER